MTGEHVMVALRDRDHDRAWRKRGGHRRWGAAHALVCDRRAARGLRNAGARVVPLGCDQWLVPRWVERCYAAGFDVTLVVDVLARVAPLEAAALHALGGTDALIPFGRRWR